jgi:hypothetical protein
MCFRQAVFVAASSLFPGRSDPRRTTAGAARIGQQARDRVAFG